MAERHQIDVHAVLQHRRGLARPGPVTECNQYVNPKPRAQTMRSGVVQLARLTFSMQSMFLKNLWNSLIANGLVKTNFMPQELSQSHLLTIRLIFSGHASVDVRTLILPQLVFQNCLEVYPGGSQPAGNVKTKRLKSLDMDTEPEALAG